MIYNFKTYESNINYILNYIVGVPSGEIIEVTKEQVLKLRAMELIQFNDDYLYFNFSDKNYDKIINMIPSTNISYIHYIMDKFNISNYVVNADLSVDVNGDVYISQKELTNLPVKFGKINGNFDCSVNNLTSLKNSPREIGGFFDCSLNNIYTLVGGPRIVSGGYYCSDNKLEDLQGFPEKCLSFDCSRNQIVSLYGIAEELNCKFFDISYNKLKNLHYGPIKTKNFDCSYNSITTLKNGLKEVNGTFNCTHNKLQDLYGVPRCNSIKYLMGNQIIDDDYD